MERGWVRLWRRSLDSAAFADPDLWKVWSWCLMRATHKPRTVSLQVGRGRHIVNLQPGEFVFGRRSAALELAMNGKSVERRLKKLEKMQNVSREVSHQYTVVTVSNWQIYQSGETGVPQSVPPMSHQCPTNVPPMSTNKNVKKDKTDRERARENPKNTVTAEALSRLESQAFDLGIDGTVVVQWTKTFDYPSDWIAAALAETGLRGIAGMRAAKYAQAIMEGYRADGGMPAAAQGAKQRMDPKGYALDYGRQADE